MSVREVTQSQRPSGLSLADTGRVVPPCARPNSADLELLSYLRHTKARVVRALRTDFATDEAMAELHKLLKECSRTMSVSEGKCSPEALHVRGLLLVCPAHTPHTVLCRLSLSSSSRLVSLPRPVGLSCLCEAAPSASLHVASLLCSVVVVQACCNFVTDTLKDFGVSGVATLDIQHPRAATPTDGMGSLDAVAQALLQFRNDVRQVCLSLHAPVCCCLL